MNTDRNCDQEDAVIRAARSSMWDESLQHHAASCPICRETLSVVMALGSLATKSPVPPAPDPRLIWLKASFAQRQKRSAFIARIAMAAYSILGAALAVGIYWIVQKTDFSPSAALLSFHLSGNSLMPLLVVGFVSVALFFVFSPAHRHGSS